MAWTDLIDEREARRLAQQLRRNARQTGVLAQDHLQHLAHDAGTVAGQAAREVARYSRREGSVLAQAAAREAARAGRAFRADPVPMLVGAVGLALLASLVLGRRR